MVDQLAAAPVDPGVVGAFWWPVVMEAYAHGASTRNLDDFVAAALGASSRISKSEVSRICTALDADA